MERPDLDAAFASLRGSRFLIPNNSTRELMLRQLEGIETYCRELEGENRRLKQALDKFNRPYTGDLRASKEAQGA